MIKILPGLAIPEAELEFTASRSSGPGGQHVNKTNTRVALRFNVAASARLSREQKRRILSRLAGRIARDGSLRVVSQAHRSQLANREAAEERLAALLRAALTPPKVRRKLELPEDRKRQRREEKRRHSEIKRDRVWRPDQED